MLNALMQRLPPGVPLPSALTILRTFSLLRSTGSPFEAVGGADADATGGAGSENGYVRWHLLVTAVAAQDTPGFLAMEWVASALVHAPVFAARPLAVAASAAARVVAGASGEGVAAASDLWGRMMGELG